MQDVYCRPEQRAALHHLHQHPAHHQQRGQHRREQRPADAALSTRQRDPYSSSTVITNEYLSRLVPFTCIRYLGWTHTNDGNLETTWATRIRWTNATIASGNGKANWESVIVMANAANKDAWICVPHQVDDDFIRKLALLFKYGSNGSEPYTSAQVNPVVPPLKPNLKLYVEYSNEIWNPGGPYPQTDWVRLRARSFGAPRSTSTVITTKSH